MGERKVVNKYYPPDFDPSRLRRPKKQPIKVQRTMIPMSLRCNTCGNFMYRATKFNYRKEDVIGETYLGIRMYRFHFKCSKCSAEFAMKTDPRNSDYTVEYGASRNFEPWREEDEEGEKEKRKRDAEEMGDSMKSLENRSLDSKRQMDALAALDEMKSIKSRHATVSVDAMLEALQKRKAMEKEKKKMELEEEDEALVKSIVFHNSNDYVRRRIRDEDLDEDGGRTSGDNLKRRKISEELLSNPTDSLTKACFLETENPDGSRAPGDAKSARIIFKSPSVRISVIKKSSKP